MMNAPDTSSWRELTEFACDKDYWLYMAHENAAVTSEGGVQRPRRGRRVCCIDVLKWVNNDNKTYIISC